MYLTAHALTGALIGEKIGNPAVAFLLGLISHYILDAIPHQDANSAQDFAEDLASKRKLSRKSKKFAIIFFIDLTALFLTANLLYNFINFNNLNSVIAGLIGSIIPDIFSGFYFYTKNKYLKKIYNFHHALHFDHEKPYLKIFNILPVQAIVLIITITFLIKII